MGGVVALTLLAAACGSSKSSSSATTAAAAGAATTTAAGATTAAPTTAAVKVSGTIQGSGSTLQKAYEESALDAFQKANSGTTITYGGGGSGKGRTDLKGKVVDYAGSDSPYADADKPAEPILYFPILLSPITVSYNVKGIDKLQLSADTIAKIFQRDIKTWNVRPSPPTTLAPSCRRPRSPSHTAPTARERRRTSPSTSSRPRRPYGS
jgi:phosphate transport system substrate-binding protein